MYCGVQQAYKMKSDPRGLAVIISNEYFLSLTPRDGTDYDLKMLENLFSQLKFKVEKYECLLAEVSAIRVFHETVAIFSFKCE